MVMRSQLSKSEFFQKMKKKPALQAILNNLDNHSIEELENIKGQPLWVRQQLVELKKRDGIDSVTSAEEIANMMEVMPLKMPEKHGVYRWIGNSWQMPCGMTGGMKIEIDFGDIFHVELTNDFEVLRLRVSSSVGYVVGPEKNRFLRDTEFLGNMTRTEYAAFVSQELTKRHGGNISAAYAGSSLVNSDDRGLFKIIRHEVK